MKFDKAIIEALDLPDDKYFHHTKQDLINTASNEKGIVTSLYPDLGPEAQSYLEMITSQSYQQTVNKVAKYLGYTTEELYRKYPNVPSFTSLMLMTMGDIMEIEDSYKNVLEKLAVQIVLELPEFTMIKDLVESGDLTIDAKLDDVDLSNALTNDDIKPQQGGLSNVEKENENLNNISQEILAKRSFAKTLTQGNAVSKFYLFHIVEDKLQEIDDTLVKKYGLITSVSTLAYYGTPHIKITKQMAQMMGGGSAEVQDENTIKCRALIFPFLVHEVVKGIWNYLTYDIASQEELDTETLDQEIIELMSGPALYDNFRKLIDVKDQYLIPLILKDLVQQPVDVIKNINLGGNKAKQLMNKLVARAKEIYDEL